MRIGMFLVMVLASGMALLFERITDAWVFMSSILASVVLVPALAALYARPKRASGLCASVAGLATLLAYYAVVYSLGTWDEEAESIVYYINRDLPLYREYAVVFALPASVLGFIGGQFFSKREVA